MRKTFIIPDRKFIVYDREETRMTYSAGSGVIEIERKVKSLTGDYKWILVQTLYLSTFKRLIYKIKEVLKEGE